MIWLAFFIGFLTKLVDLVTEHGLKIRQSVAVFSAVAYPFLTGALLFTNPELTSLAFGIILAVSIAGKLDHWLHRASVYSLFISFLLFNIRLADFPLFLVFLASALADEKWDALGLPAWRPVLEIAALLVSIAKSDFIFILAILLFDFGYLSAQKIFQKT